VERPNILFIIDDQHRHDYLGCAGADFIRTPNIDRIAERGIRFTQCTTNCPVCAPSRIGLASGLHPSRLGCVDNSGILPLSTPTYYQRLRDNSYRVACVGKLDLAKSDPYNGRYGDRPIAYSWGFTHPEECEGKMHAGSSPTPIGPYTHFLEERGLLTAFYEDYERRKRDRKSTRLNSSH
jgi:choline-sulfatase